MPSATAKTQPVLAVQDTTSVAAARNSNVWPYARVDIVQRSRKSGLSTRSGRSDATRMVKSMTNSSNELCNTKSGNSHPISRDAANPKPTWAHGSGMVKTVCV